MHYAHSTGDSGRGDWQTLPDHLDSVARIAGVMASVFGMEGAAFLAGGYHDIGKATEGFLRRLKGGPSVEHSLAGAYLVRKRNWAGIDRLMADLVACGGVDRNDGFFASVELQCQSPSARLRFSAPWAPRRFRCGRTTASRGRG